MPDPTFPRPIGIIFIEDVEKRKKSWPHLDFDQDACSYFLLQMNSIQNLFEFQVITLYVPSDYTLPDKTENIFDWFKELVGSTKLKEFGIKDWIGITSENLPGNLLLESERIDEENTASIITSYKWQKLRSPPSVFEHIVISILNVALYALDMQFNDDPDNSFLNSHYATRGCLFDYVDWLQHARIGVANPQICSSCKNDLLSLAEEIKTRTKSKIQIIDEINKVLSREWMGDFETRDSPIYNIKKIYGYDVDANSGYYKKWWEYARDSIKENSIVWLITGILSGVLALIVNLVTSWFQNTQPTP